MKALIKLSDSIHINESDVSTLELQSNHCNYWGTQFKLGTIITMKSGRKVFAEGLTPDQVRDKMVSDKEPSK